MIKFIAVGIWFGLCGHTIVTGDVSVISQSIAQGTLGLILVIECLREYFK
ncbi:hypothetical protein [Erwinia phage Virsaitis27]|nr:hypothetical protein [Erwinia phage Virsaitis27]